MGSKDARGRSRVGRPRASAGRPETPEVDPLIVGVGASAGGLEALERLLSSAPVGRGLAFIVVQHLDPTREGMLAELLQRATGFAVAQARAGERVAADHVYTIPPGRDIALVDGVLHLSESSGIRGHRLPVDVLFRSLAEDRGVRAVGIVLSGMGSDGTLGAKAIRAGGGTVLAQDPGDAEFDAMPRSVIDAGVVDEVAAAHELAERVLSPAPHAARAPASSADGGALGEVIQALLEATGHDFSQYKETTLNRRIERRLAVHRLESVAEYVAFVAENPDELDLLFGELLIGVTEFFRDPEGWEVLRTVAIPKLLAAQPGVPLRAWVSACSTGEEAYSLAIALQEAVIATGSSRRHGLQVFATDIDGDAIDRARRGVYPAQALAAVPPELIDRYFVPEGESYRVASQIREMIVFSLQDLLSDPPFTKLDLLLCRNLLIYLEPELQSRLVRVFHFALQPGGVLMLGKSETPGLGSSLFMPLAESAPYVYGRSAGRTAGVGLQFAVRPSRATRDRAKTPEEAPAVDKLAALTDRRLLRGYAPAAVLVNAEGDILYISGRTGRYLEPAAGKADWNIHAMAREGLQTLLAGALRTAVQGSETVRLSVHLRDDPGTATVDVTVEPIREPDELAGKLLIVFSEGAVRTDTTAPPSAAELSSPSELVRELRQAREEQRVLQQQKQSVQEELQATNEELQSSNEELMASKEELQSLNEELQTVNVELQSKVDALTLVSDDMTNLLNSTDLAIVFLDAGLRVRRFTPFATRLFRLLPHDLGRPLSDIATELDHPTLFDDLRDVLERAVVREATVSASGSRWFQMRIIPYTSRETVADGLVVTFSDVTVAKTLELRLRSTGPLDDRPAHGVSEP